MATPADPPSSTNEAPVKTDKTARQAIDLNQQVDRFGDALFRFAVAKTGDHALAEDLVQDTFVAAVAAQRGFRGQASVSTWLFAILKRKIADHHRQCSRRPVHGPLGADTLPISNDSSDVFPRRRDGRSHWASDPAKICQDIEFWAAVDSCVEKLPGKLSEAFILREINQHSPEEIRELLGISATNLSMRLYRCRMAVKDCLNKHWFEKDA
ncbi:sigma-70 family RNA polymerase sigma factor [Rubripirellula reticaptiva]|uniref:ECF RNA polymerase sigma factor SigE n=1 Tax=Rubripirellula reticaptiva TaxID=2528013 RepID=A0A5C6ESS7_9BACT|nr:sigma-70 family RNA polymerase sigma factor [Rubripirellula reticaptiva]TWU51380.1 ECF RNA polymerase sigma factor SigE [Rubripirellula reticaptiva]